MEKSNLVSHRHLQHLGPPPGQWCRSSNSDVLTHGILACRIKYAGVDGEVRTWEAMHRTTRPLGSAVDAVQMLVVLNKPTGPELLLEKQFRPPAGKRVVEFPAGLVDKGETTAQAAVRELREETGYVGEVLPDRGGFWPVLWDCESLDHARSC
jgi:hypothetical protein